MNQHLWYRDGLWINRDGLWINGQSAPFQRHDKCLSDLPVKGKGLWNGVLGPLSGLITYFLQFSSNCSVSSRKCCFAGRYLQLSVPLSVCNAGLALGLCVFFEALLDAPCLMKGKTIKIHGEVTVGPLKMWRIGFPKRRLLATNSRCVKSDKSEDHICTAEEARNNGPRRWK